MRIITLSAGWVIKAYVDDDNHLNVFIHNGAETISEVACEMTTGENGEPLGLRFTTDEIEKEYREEQTNDLSEM